MNPLTAEDTVVVNGITVTNVAVTLIHLAAGGHDAGKAMDDALRRGNKPNDLREVFERWKGQGVKGPSAVLELLADRVDRRLPRSWFQRLAKDLFAAEAVHLVDVWWSDLERMAEVVIDVQLAMDIARARNLVADPTKSV